MLSPTRVRVIRKLFPDSLPPIQVHRSLCRRRRDAGQRMRARASREARSSRGSDHRSSGKFRATPPASPTTPRLSPSLSRALRGHAVRQQLRKRGRDLHMVGSPSSLSLLRPLQPLLNTALDTPSPLPSQPPPGNSPPSSQEGSSSVGSDSGASDPPALSLKPGQKITVEALRVATYVDVLWQDGTESIAVPSSDLYPGYTFDEHEFFPGTRVLMETSNSDAVNAPQKGMDGIVQWASQADRTAMVRWLPADRPGDAEEDDELSQLIEKEHAVYELKVDEYFHYRYHIGDIVLLLRGGGIIPKCYVLDVRSEMKKLEEQFSPSLSKSCQKGDSDEVDS
ncbi:unnamed protein product, partial [Cyprideis torosa]